MKNTVWSKALKSSADPQRARHYYDLLRTTSAGPVLEAAGAEEVRILCAIFSGSQALSGWLMANPEWVRLLSPELLGHPRREQGMRREVQGRLAPRLKASDYQGALARVRQFKQREMLRIGARDLARLGNVETVMGELSHVADVCLSAVWEICRKQLSERVGRPYQEDIEGRWLPATLCVFALGKLGGEELNYSSDVDVIFVYSEEGRVFKSPPGKGKTTEGGMSNHQFFNRLAEMFIAEVGRMTAEGMLYRIDLRLRPEGDAGPLARSVESYENYYAQWGQTWERMMLIKARRVAGDESLATEFLDMVQAFRYPRSPGMGVVREVAAMKLRIEKEVLKADELDRNVKLGRGGIREIEFVAQTTQLIHAGRLPFLQGTQTLPTLAKLAQYDLLGNTETRLLIDAYRFLRDVEHRLQMEDNLQTHTIPVAPAARERLAALMGFRTLKGFEAARSRHTNAVRQAYDRLLRGEKEEPQSTLPKRFEGEETTWKTILTGHSFKNAGDTLRLLDEFVNGPGYAHVSNRTSALALQLLPRMFMLCPRPDHPAPEFDPTSKVLSDSDRVLTRLDSFITAYGARATLFEMWSSNPSLFELLLQLFDRSEFLAEAAIRTPDLVDELVLSGRLRQRKTAGEILKDLRHGRDDADQRFWLRRYHQAELMRIGLRDILGLADFEQNLEELSALAEACLEYALEITLRKKYPGKATLAIIGLGKLGGAELNYGSDLDIVFVAEAKTEDLPKLQRVAVEVMDMLSSRTELGIAFLTDARLRPDGEKGLLVNTREAYENYYRNRAQLWEIQALTRARPVAGDADLGQRFMETTRTLTDFRPDNVAGNFVANSQLEKDTSSAAGEGGRKKAVKKKATGAGLRTGLAAYVPDWKTEIRRMRNRIEKERTLGGQDELAIKTGAGGLMDAEFLAQIFSLAHGWQEANTLQGLQRARQAGALSPADADHLIESYRQLRRVEGILRRWSFEGETVLPAEAEPYQRVAIRCGFGTPEAFKNALAKYRRAIRLVYNKVFCE